VTGVGAEAGCKPVAQQDPATKRGGVTGVGARRPAAARVEAKAESGGGLEARRASTAVCRARNKTKRGGVTGVGARRRAAARVDAKAESGGGLEARRASTTMASACAVVRLRAPTPRTP
jgi:hypothetical protein